MVHILRLSLDINEKDPSKNLRFTQAVESIRQFSGPNHKLVILGHRGRPGGKRVRHLSLKKISSQLAKTLGIKIIFFEKHNFPAIRKVIEGAPAGTLFMLENVRFLPGETRNENLLVKKLASLGDGFIDDDFANSHRMHASNYGLAGALPSKMGPHFKNELTALEKILHNTKSPSILILGGAKTSDKLPVMKKLLSKFDYILLGGGPANTVLRARGVHIGKSMHDAQIAEKEAGLFKKEKIVTPVDWEVSADKILDIGPNTIREYRRIISKARTIIWNGPMGYFENPKFAKGTSSVARAVFANKKAYVLIGGGDTLASIRPPKNNKKLLISTGGGAMLTYLAGGKLPAVEAIKKNER